MLEIAQVMLWKGVKRKEDRSGYRPISITNAAYKLLALVLLDRLERETRGYLQESQAGARKGMTCLHPLTVIRLTMERLLKTDVKLALLLIDFKQAFNAPTPKSMDDSMKQAKASPKVRAMIRMIDENVSYYTRMQGQGKTQYSREFKATKGCPMGCPTSPWRFIILLQYVINITDNGQKVLTDAEFAQMKDGATCEHCNAGYKKRPNGGATGDLNQREKSACYACRHTLRGGNLGLPDQEPGQSNEEYTWYTNELLEQGIQFDAQQFVDDYLMMAAGATEEAALKAVVERGADTLAGCETLTKMESQGDKCEKLARVHDPLDSLPVTVEQVKEMDLQHVECDGCKSLYETHIGLKRHHRFCTAVDTPSEEDMPAAGFALHDTHPLCTFRGKPDNRYWLIRWKNIVQRGHGDGLPDETGHADWQPERNLMINKHAMIRSWTSMHPQVDMKGDNEANDEYRCPTCNQKDFRTAAARDRHTETCPRRHTHTVSRGLKKKVKLARLEKALKLKNTSKINGKKVPHKLSSKYLGSFITHDGTSIKEAKFRIARARKKFNSMFVLWKSKRLTKSHKYKLYTGVLAAMLYACPTWRRSPDVLRAINGANATMISVISKKKSRYEASASGGKQTFNIKNEMRWQSMKWALVCLQSSNDTHAKQELLRFALAIRCKVVDNDRADQSLLQDIPLQDNNQELLIWAGCLPEQGVITPKMRGVAETNKMLRAQELEDLRPKFELTEKDKDKEEELAKKDKEEEEKLKENETEKLIAAIDKDSAEVKPEYKREALDWLASLPTGTVMLYTDGGYDPPDKDKAARAGWGAEMWYRYIPERDIDDRPRALRGQNRPTILYSLKGPVITDVDSPHYVAAV